MNIVDTAAGNSSYYDGYSYYDYENYEDYYYYYGEDNAEPIGNQEPLNYY